MFDGSEKMKGIRVVSIFIILLLVSSVFVPGVLAAQTMKDMSPETRAGQVVKLNNAELTVSENTWTSTVFQIGDMVSSLKSNPDHSGAVIKIQNMTNGEFQIYNLFVIKNNGKYVVYTFDHGFLISTWESDIDPLAPNSFGTLIDSQTSKQENDHPDVTSTYSWDGVIYTKDGIAKYPHPDYATYGIDPSQRVYVPGTKLKHTHFSQNDSTLLKTLPIAGAVAALVILYAITGNLVAPVTGALMTAVGGWVTGEAFLDEKGCNWQLQANDWGNRWFVLPPTQPVLIYAPKYERSAGITLWDDLGIGNP